MKGHPTRSQKTSAAQSQHIRVPTVSSHKEFSATEIHVSKNDAKVCETENISLQLSTKNGFYKQAREAREAYLEAVAARVQSPDQANSNAATEEGQQDAEAAEVLQGNALADQHIPQHQEVGQGIVHAPHH